MRSSIRQRGHLSAFEILIVRRNITARSRGKSIEEYSTELPHTFAETEEYRQIAIYGNARQSDLMANGSSTRPSLKAYSSSASYCQPHDDRSSHGCSARNAVSFRLLSRASHLGKELRQRISQTNGVSLKRRQDASISE